jgi:sialate O-acetylesterase
MRCRVLSFAVAFRAIATLLSLCCFGLGRVNAAVTPAGIFTDNMVLQRDMALPVWGTADGGEKVAVSIEGQKIETEASPQGQWRVELKPLKAGGPYELRIDGAKNQIALKNVLVGDVWIASGQSNMELNVQSAANAPAEIAGSANSKIRLFTVPRHGAPKPETDVNGHWEEAGPKTVPSFSAVAYFFGRALEKETHVPVGLINCNVGGTTAERWMSKESLDAIPALKDMPRTQGANDLYNAMVHPLIPFGIRGAIWYQGESNAGQAWYYRTLFPAMIKDWRDEWKEGDFPFLFVQLAPFMSINPEPTDSEWAELRDAQLHTMQTVPNTAMAVITDVGDERDIHPKRKQQVGERLALAARALANGEKLEYSGPIFDHLAVEGHDAIVHFKHVGAGLTVKGDKLTGFTISGEDRKFHNATARIDGNTVIVSSPQVANPVAVRFGWANYPVVNLWNNDGLPASPFHSDNFPLRTQPKGK